MAITVACGVLLLIGLVAGAWWSGRSFVAPPQAVDLSPREVARRFVFYVAVALASGVVTGVSVIGAGGRLAMRLLAVTAGADAQGRVTEAEEVVGKITLEGTLGFVLFTGVLGGAAAGVLFVVVRRFLPPGRLGGLAFGLGLFLVLGPVIDPIRTDNPDFDLVGPGWLAIAVFAALALAFGMTLASLTNRISAALPLISWDRGVLLRYAGPALIAAVTVSFNVVLLAACLIAVAATRRRAVLEAVQSQRWVLAGRVVALSAVAISLPRAGLALADIATR